MKFWNRKKEVEKLKEEVEDLQDILDNMLEEHDLYKRAVMSLLLQVTDIKVILAVSGIVTYKTEKEDKWLN